MRNNLFSLCRYILTHETRATKQLLKIKRILNILEFAMRQVKRNKNIYLLNIPINCNS